jgi:hypothetical protein
MTTHESDELVALLFDQVNEWVKDRTPRSVSLDELGELVGDRPITSAQIELLIANLEGSGIIVGGDHDVDLKGLLRTVIQTALQLRQTGQAASPQAIAEQSGLSGASVRIALLYSEVIRRPS